MLLLRQSPTKTQQTDVLTGVFWHHKISPYNGVHDLDIL